MSNERRRRLPHFLCGSGSGHFRHLQSVYGGVDPEFRRRAAVISTASWSLAPERCWESLRHESRAKQIELHPAPVFIIGHWQSGHSLMHELMANDPQFAVVRLLHSVLPKCWVTLEPCVQQFLAKRLNRTRHVDDLPLSLDAPQGDDFAMASLSDISIYHAYTFPRAAELAFRRAVLLEGLSDEEVHQWQQTYRSFLQKVAWFTAKSRRLDESPSRATSYRLLSRNGTNTGRIPRVLEMFPQAKFIHLVRNPYHVYAAQSQRWRELTALWGLQSVPLESLTSHAVGCYQAMLQKYLADRNQIPVGQLAEVQYEELLENPMSTLESVYSQLALSGFDELRSRLDNAASARPGKLAGHDSTLSEQEREIVANEWRFAFEAFGYPQ